MTDLMRRPSRDQVPIDPDDLDEIDRLFFDAESLAPDAHASARASRIVALLSPKGGTGKTSIAVMLAGVLSTRRRRTALLDLDPRHGVGRWRDLANGLPFATYEFDAKRGAAAFRRAVREAIAGVDLLVLDTPSTMGPAIRLALQVADLVLIPATASSLDLAATQDAVDAARKARHGRDGSLPFVMIVPSRQDLRTRLARDFERRFKDFNAPLAPAIGQRVEVAAAASAGRLVRSNTESGREFARLARHVWSFLEGLDA